MKLAVRHPGPRLWRRAAVAAIAIGLVACGGDGPLSRTVDFPVPWSEAKAVDYDTVELRYTHGPCASYVRTDVQEAPSQVVLTIIVQGKADRPCNDLGLSDVVTVDLPAPLGGRELVNGACQDERFSYRPECSSTTTSSSP